MKKISNRRVALKRSLNRNRMMVYRPHRSNKEYLNCQDIDEEHNDIFNNQDYLKKEMKKLHATYKDADFFNKDNFPNQAHYNFLKIQPIEFIVKNNIGFMEGNAIKYIVRYKNKNGVDDLLKCRTYLLWMLEYKKNHTDDDIQLQSNSIKSSDYDNLIEFIKQEELDFNQKYIISRIFEYNSNKVKTLLEKAIFSLNMLIDKLENKC